MMPLTLGVVGLGYVGLTLTAALAESGNTVYGVDTSMTVLDGIRKGRLHLHEPGLARTIQNCFGSTVFVGQSLPTQHYDAVFISVNTNTDENHRVILDHLEAATRAVAQQCPQDTLVVIRSTVPIGTTRTILLPILQEAWTDPLVCMAPERTIQGQALREIVELPQVVGGVDERSTAAGRALFEQLVDSVVVVSNADTAEMVKLSNNAHTDLIYGFGNEIALIADQHGIDPLEVIRACNLDYPRPDLSRPGLVGGACLTKDPHILMGCTPGYDTPMVRSARELNESMPVHVAQRAIALLEETRGRARGATIAILGWACKGTPATDDVRGTAVESMVPELLAAGVRVLAHDPLVSDEVVQALGGEPRPLDVAVAEADGVIVVNDHPLYRGLDLLAASGTTPPLFVYDVWRVLDERALTAAGVAYAGLGYRASPGRAVAPKLSVVASQEMTA